MMKDTRGGVMTQRRRLLAGAGLAAAVPGRLLAAGAPDTLDPGASGVWDVIVAGSGAAGLSAAAAALESGAGHVLVLEKGPLVGGHSIYSSGSVSAVAPSRSHDPNDTLGRFVEDALEVGGDTGDAAVLAKIGEDSAGVLDWLESLGVFWSEPFIAYSGKQAKSYAMPGNSAGRSYVLALMAHLRRFGCRLALSTPVTGFRPEGACVGCRSEIAAGRKNAQDAKPCHRLRGLHGQRRGAHEDQSPAHARRSDERQSGGHGL